MKLLLDFHYSDFWTDPGKQFKPKAWEKLDYPQLKTAIHDYTRDTIARFKQAGVLPDMVQIGNEINGGILWPEGKSWGQGGGEFDRLAGLLNAAIAGLKENLRQGEQVKIMLHLAEGTKNDTFRWWFDEIDKRHVPYDVIGLSMYTYWNGPISALKANMDDISKRYNKTSSSSRRPMPIPWPTAITRKIVSRQKRKRMEDIPPAYRGNITIFTI
ncbi:galactosidase [Klebsiella pneumoniae]|uniref:Arabinogalactan endo-beta-1,4-galactanase n=1 Tax=Klebsiella pneumoniae TaxID=573 RepID=A0A4P0XRN3_KLEPN|nr:galactosidase [Klebsiella pneumoniae]